MRVSIWSHRGAKVVSPDFQPMRVSEEPVCIDIFRQNPVFTSLHLRYPVHVVPPRHSVQFGSKLEKNVCGESHIFLVRIYRIMFYLPWAFPKDLQYKLQKKLPQRKHEAFLKNFSFCFFFLFCWPFQASWIQKQMEKVITDAVTNCTPNWVPRQ
jgi:hypothetical protein